MTNDPQKMAQLIKEQAEDNERQDLLNALQAAGQALTTASLLIERTGAKTANDIEALIEQIKSS